MMEKRVSEAIQLLREALTSKSRCSNLKRQLKDSISGDLAMDQGVSFNFKHESAFLDSSISKWKKISQLNFSQSLSYSHDLLRREEKANILSVSGGCCGTMEFASTGWMLGCETRMKS